MPLYGEALVLQYVAWDTSANAGKTGDVANHTLKLIQDGTANTPTNSPSEVDATNCPGVYKLSVTAAEMSYNVITLAGKSSTASVSILPITVITEGTLEGSLAMTQILRIILAAVAGKSDGITTATVHCRDQADGKNRITATIDGSGNRTAVTVDGS